MAAWNTYFTNPIQAPNANTGEVVLTGALADIGIAAGTFYPFGGFALNETGSAITLVLQDGAGKSLVPGGAPPGDTEIGPGQTWGLPDYLFMMPIDASSPIKAKGNGLKFHLWGYLIS